MAGSGTDEEVAEPRRTAVEELTGYVLVDKEAGWTSHDVVARCRTIFGQRKIGHAGTLDPDATGVLLVGLGRATRLLRFASALGKSYMGEVVLGISTTTLDASGAVVARHDMSGVTLGALQEAALALTGRISQIPPMVSAVKVGGRRLYEIARQGGEVERAPRVVSVTRFNVSPTDDPQVYRIEVDCSSGTYVRVLAADLGAAVGGGAHLRALRRVSVGSFRVDEARRLADLSAADVRLASEMVRDMPAVVVSGDLELAVRHGKVLDRSELGVVGDGPWVVLAGSGSMEGDPLLAVYEAAVGAERVKPAVVVRPASGVAARAADEESGDGSSSEPS